MRVFASLMTIEIKYIFKFKKEQEIIEMSAASARSERIPEETLENLISSENIRREVLDGLLQTPKRISPKYFYDEKGSELFDSITQLDEYYVPRIERSIFSDYSAAICAEMGQDCVLIEPGAGACEKVKWLLPDLAPAAYVPMDISAEFLQKSAAGLRENYPDLTVLPLAFDHTQELSLEGDLPSGPAVFFYPGSSIGNFEPEDAVDFLKDLHNQIDDEGGLLIGVDTKKDPAVLHAAYNDCEGVTAQFNLNVLSHLNDLLGGSFDEDKFEHVAFYNEEAGRIEMHLRSLVDHEVLLGGNQLEFASGEMVHTEHSYKYRPEEFVGLAAEAGFHNKQIWQDDDKLFSVMYFTA